MRTRRRLLKVAVILACLAGAAAAAAQTPDQRERFRTADKNGDGKVDREEFHQRTIEVFYFLDTARRGHLTVEQLQGVLVETFRSADKNGDGRLSLEEFLAARHRDFDAADTNRDGVVIYEVVEAYSKIRP
jgi:Ca2+-binding EF-hand superfamily protein